MKAWQQRCVENGKGKALKAGEYALKGIGEALKGNEEAEKGNVEE